MQSRSIARELALLVLGQIPENHRQDLESLPIESLMNKAIDGLVEHCREGLDSSANQLEAAHQNLLEIELQDIDKNSVERIQKYLKASLADAENVLNVLSASLEFPRLLILSDQETIRKAALKHVNLVFQQRNNIDARLDSVMEGWRLKRLPRVDRDILRLAFID